MKWKCRFCGGETAGKDAVFCKWCGQSLHDGNDGGPVPPPPLNGSVVEALALEPAEETVPEAIVVGAPTVDAGDGTDSASESVPCDAAPPTVRYRVEILSGHAAGKATTVTENGHVLVGASSSSELCVPDDDLVSRRHATFAVKDGNLCVVDSASSNGTYLRLEGECEVHAGACILMGRTLLRVTRED
jgi:hypothetical protein